MNKIDVACIIDDDPIFVFGAKRMMELSDFCNSFMVFKNGQEALNSLKPIMIAGENVPDIILLDINMPIMDGWQFLEELVKIESHKLLTIYIVSSSIDPADINRAKHYKTISNYIIKPISTDTLKEILQIELAK
ncbi:response regulator receiver domain-containing protein [Winogradskyella pacifica]|uniref:Response regulator receiver domain-containing protein n=1 Tax=Winogradskyella pacifica TaxID=664642 RepID=A0A3D9N3B5_9FLAO|nr:response regulator [Winogradskyella pacifica]REE27397.1 response regulator receiver domain-containing protein [Winogradskyella pacifica]